VKKFFGVLLIVVGVSSSVSAADLPRAPYTKAPVAPISTWTGFYAGLNLGYGFNDPTVAYTPNDPTAAGLFGTPGPQPSSYNIEGILGGVQVGYNWQIAPTWLLGLEADFQGSRIKGSASPSNFTAAVPLAARSEQQLDWFGTVRARVGFLANERLLVYGTGGLAYGSLHNSAQLATTTAAGVGIAGAFGVLCPGGAGVVCMTGSENKLQTGYTVGGGLEFAVWQNVTLKAEYLYVNLGTSSVTAFAINPLGATPASFTANFSDFDFHVVRAGVNYRF
jgi:outer membrane immunogenic protein